MSINRNLLQSLYIQKMWQSNYCKQQTIIILQNKQIIRFDRHIIVYINQQQRKRI
ncbi:unnamed protein product [Paramecium octaurelia]|uniref:Uncharacterized protein n=1 Tax=Paramecium octaurelia TaxID=43137 RepID=A0A8S1V7I6_PAROT|nr:unnamed protein product [Paramecium octaurelia]